MEVFLTKSNIFLVSFGLSQGGHSPLLFTLFVDNVHHVLY